MSRVKRLKVIIMLSAGGIATAASIVRMILVLQLENSNDESADFIQFNLLGIGSGGNSFAPHQIEILAGHKVQVQNLVANIT
ncbi:uncharacterized protein ColSpa_08911 [Colletotrichum spaethianum]|uniref:Uncharacterized protein n=1 Tax=Colletotrichum spaethianum TaxID=700344 RepID=A0AA37PAQ9_9PEZI|nr:uncharacterized protein ColSpa_08911 [Colletotrichum spaethianum]GKT48730.1 hypothetical protein ColSpa_08911 [Colletotrichum spaethianum]